ncbi:MAG: alpha/beta fold hydrolase [Deltaproteobacteria bacterium]|nr:alpha/beta fold hydrolase [Deltaproteobacteria bacterium]
MALPLVTGCLGFHRGAMPGEPADATYADVEGARVRYTDTGSGPVVVMLHGFASSLETWTAVAPQLAKNHRVIALDLKGFGWTDRPEGDYSPDAQATLVWALLDQRGVKKASIVAHSWGSSIALAMAIQQPDRVEKIALYDAYVYEEQLPTFFLWARARGVGETLFGLYYDQRPDERLALAFYDQRYVTQQLVDDVQKALDRPGTRAAALAAVRGMHFAEQQLKYRSLRKPALLLWGREDRVTTLDVGERLARDLDAKLVAYPRCGHFPMIEAAEQSNAELQRFLEGQP